MRCAIACTAWALCLRSHRMRNPWFDEDIHGVYVETVKGKFAILFFPMPLRAITNVCERPVLLTNPYFISFISDVPLWSPGISRQLVVYLSSDICLKLMKFKRELKRMSCLCLKTPFSFYLSFYCFTGKKEVLLQHRSNSCVHRIRWKVLRGSTSFAI